MGIEDILGKNRKPTEEETAQAEVEQSDEQKESSITREAGLQALLEEGQRIGLSEGEIKHSLESIKQNVPIVYPRKGGWRDGTIFSIKGIRFTTQQHSWGQASEYGSYFYPLENNRDVILASLLMNEDLDALQEKFGKFVELLGKVAEDSP